MFDLYIEKRSIDKKFNDGKKRYYLDNFMVTVINI